MWPYETPGVCITPRLVRRYGHRVRAIRFLSRRTTSASCEIDGGFEMNLRTVLPRWAFVPLPRMLRRASGRHAAISEPGHLLGDPSYSLGRRGVQDAGRVSGNRSAQYPQGDEAPQGAAGIPVRARPGRLREAVSGAIPRPGGRFPQVSQGRAAATGGRARCHARCEHARRRDVHPSDAIWQRVLSAQAGRRGHGWLAGRHVRASRPDAAASGAWRLQVVLVLARGAAGRSSVGVLLGGDRRHEDSGLLSALQLRPALSLAPGLARVLFIRQAAVRHAEPEFSRAAPRWAFGRGCVGAGGTPRAHDRSVQQEGRCALRDADGPPFRLRDRGRRAQRSSRLPRRVQPDLPGNLQQPDRAQGAGCGYSSRS